MDTARNTAERSEMRARGVSGGTRKMRYCNPDEVIWLQIRTWKGFTPQGRQSRAAGSFAISVVLWMPSSLAAAMAIPFVPPKHFIDEARLNLRKRLYAGGDGFLRFRAEGLRKVFGLDESPGTQDEGIFNDVLELADVPRVVVAEQDP